MVLLCRDDPLPDDIDLKALLADLGAQPFGAETGLSVAWFENGALVTNEKERGPSMKNVVGSGSPMERINDEVQKRVGRHFGYTRAVTFGNLGGK